MKRHERKFRLMALLAAVSLTLTYATEPAHGATVDWSDSFGGSYEASSNWTPPSPTGGPKVTDDVVFDLPNFYTVTFNSSPTNNSLSILDGDVTFTGIGILPRVYTLNDAVEIDYGRLVLGNSIRPMHINIDLDSIYVNMGGRLDIVNGSLSNVACYIGADLGALNTVTVGGVLGSSAVWTNSSLLSVGYNSHSALMIHNGGQVSNTDGYIAQNRDSTGTVTVQDAGSSWTNSGNLSIGGSLSASGGTGELNVTGGSVSVASTLKVWPGSSLNLSGGQVTTASMTVTDGGQMNLTGGTLTVDGGAFNSLAPGISLNSDDNPTLNLINGATASHSGEMMVAYNSEGTLNINSGSTLTTGNSLIGNSSGATGLVVVDDGTWTVSGIFSIGPGGIGELNITNGSTVSNSGTALVGSGTSGLGTITIDNSTWNSARLSLGQDGNGVMSIRNGGHVITSEGEVGLHSSGTGQVTVDDGTWTNDGSLVLSHAGQAALLIDNGGQVSNTDCTIAEELGSLGQATVHGAGSVWTNTNLYIGGSSTIDGGNGTLTISNGGTINVTDELVLWYSGMMTVNGGTIRFSQPESFRNNGGILNYHSGTVELECDADIGNMIGGSSTVAAFFGPSPNIPTGKHLSVTGEASLLSKVTLSGGTFSADSLVNPWLLQFDSGTFNLTGDDLSIALGGLFGRTLEIYPEQQIGVTNNATVGPTGLLLINGGTFSASTTINQGEISLASIPSGTPALLAGSVVDNRGFIYGEGRISAELHNAATGMVDIAADSQLVLTGTTNINHGMIANSGGTLRATGLISNETGGHINATGQTMLSLTGGLDNSGTVTFTSADAYMYSNITNNVDGLVGLANASTVTFIGAFINNGNVYVGTDSRGVFCGPVSGSGNFSGAGTVEFIDEFSPGSSPAAISFGGDVLFSDSALLAMELGGIVGGDQYDQLKVTGVLDIGGTLQVSLIDDFSPSTGDTFDILDWGVLSGSEFETIELPQLAGRNTWDTSLLYTTGSISVIGMLPGDTDIDWDVDQDDLSVLLATFGGPAGWRTDFNQDARVDLADFVIMRANFGIGTSPEADGAAMETPEPATLSLLALGGLAISTRRRRRITQRAG
ncbi:MAG: PEP-CTERM sorting domain-containing protein [Phycisphaerales bacterium]|jgi:T5SS/PEP-CTERM-associated repeat protein|nr:PEP-CTERM sorting domain-containing protein [Phycisphaerales bacterium]